MPFLKIEELMMQNLNMPSLHSHPYYEIYFLYEGERFFFSNSTLYTIKAPGLFIIPPHHIHKTEGKHFKRINLYVTPDYLDSFQTELLERLKLTIIHLKESEAKKLLDILHLSADASPLDAHFDLIQKAKFSYFLLVLNALTKENAPPSISLSAPTPPIVLRTIHFLNENYVDQNLDLDFICKEFNISTSTLMYNFKKSLNCSPMNYLLNIRITKVKQALLESDKTINEIAEMCGFSSGNYLSFIFKKKEKISPKAYRLTYSSED